jgi:Amt family ammonium transporter
MSKLQRLKERDVQKRWFVLLAGKMLGIVGLLGLMKGGAWLMGGVASAAPAQTPDIPNADLVSGINTTWLLVTAFLVFFMQAGFMALEAGFARSKESVNVLLECVFDTCLCGLLFWAFGFAFMFGLGNGWIGHQFFFLNNAPATYTLTGATGVAFMAFFLFQFAFADTCSTVTSGAMVGRTSFHGDILYSMAVSGFIYPIFGHWVWGPDGWLGHPYSWMSHFGAGGTNGVAFRDFAGSTVVHTVGAVIAFWGAFFLGPRIGRKFKSEGGGPLPPHDLTMASIGAVILWFGWYGFNPGSTLSALDAVGIGRVATNTTLAAAAAGLTAIFVVYPRSKKWDLGISLNGFLAGLVAITCPCYWVNAFGAVVIGAVAGVVVVIGVDTLERFHIDDPIGAVPVHGFCGVWGTLSLGLFGVGKGAYLVNLGTAAPVKGLFYGGGWHQLGMQFFGSASAIFFVSLASIAVFYPLTKMGWLRLSQEGELEGLDLHEHGTASYHMEFGQGMTYTTLTGAPRDLDLGTPVGSSKSSV